MLLFVFIIMSFSVYAEETKTYDGFEYIVKGDEICITECNKPYKKGVYVLKFPDEIENKPVTSIGSSFDCIYQDLKLFTKYIIFPSHIKEVDMGQFSGFASLKEVTLGRETRSFQPLGYYEAGDHLLEYDVKIPGDALYIRRSGNTIYSKDKKILYAVVGGTSKRTYKMPKSITEIMPEAFSIMKYEKVKFQPGIKKMYFTKRFYNVQTIYVPSKCCTKYKKMIKKAVGSKRYKALKIKKY